MTSPIVIFYAVLFSVSALALLWYRQRLQRESLKGRD